ncbi:immunoglobulin-like domain-containing protein [Colwellia psychrerythraea]|uniref:Lipoprotein n=1 Tax=Colwellia psychrerythraea TaxID=28229 RepID=A0A099KW36_COLPS|nr:immunoglobulin-like domain-containing protein [Colwellia psychrerythraea]KGJ94786.1 lipoprotein [Colwellia psychrerythraea]
MKFSSLAPVFLLSLGTLTACGSDSSDPTPTVEDTTAPVITLNGGSSLTHSAGTDYADEGATANDATDGTVSVTITGAVDSDVVSSYTLTYSASDKAGNKNSITRTVNVVDTIAPVITIAGDSPLSHSAGTDYSDAGATAEDATDGTVDVVTTGNVDSAVVESYTLTYTATDAAGNSSTATRTVNVVDDIAPVLVISGANPLTHNVFGTYIDLGAVVTDNVDDANAITITATGEVKANVIGSYTVTYTATDAANNAATPVVRTVNVADLTAPEITLTGDAIIEHNYAAIYDDQGATAVDAVDGDVAATTTDTVLINKIGSYGLTYIATDAAGNEATLERVVNVVDITGPVITLTGGNTISLGKGRVYKELGATALDNLDGVVVVGAPTGTVDYDTIGQYELTYTVTDTANNVSSQVRTVDVVAPTPFITTWKTDNNGVSADNEITITTNPAHANYNYTVDWGDGSTSENLTGDSPPHTYAIAGTYTVTISGDFHQLYFFSNSFDNDKLLSVEQWGDGLLLSLSQAFVGCDNLVINASDTPNLRSVVDLSYMFYEASSFNQDINAWDVSSITDMNSMFEGATSFNQALNSWDVSSVLEMKSIFREATSFNQDISQWNMGSVTDTRTMFYNAIAFNQNIGSWDVSSLTTMSSMFNKAISFDQDISSWNIGLVTNMKSLFFGLSISTEYYDALLDSWSKQEVQSGVTFGVGTSQYSPSSQDARDILTGKGWLITDGGATP